jgi:hypothetical protein
MAEKLRKGEFGEHYDSKGRVCSPQGVPFRNASTRKIVDENGTTRTGVGVAFRGKAGKGPRKATRHLAKRVKQYEDEQGAKGYRSNPFERHKPGSLQFG